MFGLQVQCTDFWCADAWCKEVTSTDVQCKNVLYMESAFPDDVGSVIMSGASVA